MHSHSNRSTCLTLSMLGKLFRGSLSRARKSQADGGPLDERAGGGTWEVAQACLVSLST